MSRIADLERTERWLGFDWQIFLRERLIATESHPVRIEATSLCDSLAERLILVKNFRVGFRVLIPLKVFLPLVGVFRVTDL
jgi:hypothetical protein